MAKEACDAVADEVWRIESKHSRFRDDSFLSDMNRVAATGGSITLDPETSDLMTDAQACHRKSGGLFDTTSGLESRRRLLRLERLLQLRLGDGSGPIGIHALEDASEVSSKLRSRIPILHLGNLI